MSEVDFQLMDQFKRGDQSAFGLLIERHQRAVYGYLRARLLQASDADDMTQEVFLRCFQARARFDATAMVRPWLLGIARNLLREHVRAVKRRRQVAWTELCLELESGLPVDDARQEEIQTHLPTCLDGLGPSARQAIEEHYRDGRRLADIGAALQRSEGAVKLLMHRARLALRACLEKKLRA